MPLMDEYGGHRPGDNLYGNSIVALDAKTGVRKWHFQMVHHDIWDYDVPMAPNLMDVTVNGARRKVVAQTTKQGWVYTFDRVTGEPIWPMPETPMMKSDVPGEVSSPTQPIPSKPAPYSQQGLVEADLIDYTPAIRDSALKLAKRCRMGPYFIPPAAADGKGSTGYKCSWYAPGASGGVNIDGGAAVDVETGMLYVASQTGMSTAQVQKDPCSEFDYSSPRDSCGLLGALPAPPGYVKPASGDRGGDFGARSAGSVIGGVSIVKPKPYGGITAYNMNSGDKAWWIPNGGMMKVTSRDPLFAGVTLPDQGARGQAASHHHQVAGDLRHRSRWWRAGRAAPAVRRGQGHRQAGRGGQDRVEDHRRADDVPAPGPAVHRVRDGHGREHGADGIGPAAKVGSATRLHRLVKGSSMRGRKALR